MYLKKRPKKQKEKMPKQRKGAHFEQSTDVNMNDKRATALSPIIRVLWKMRITISARSAIARDEHSTKGNPSPLLDSYLSQTQ